MINFKTQEESLLTLVFVGSLWGGATLHETGPHGECRPQTRRTPCSYRKRNPEHVRTREPDRFPHAAHHEDAVHPRFTYARWHADETARGASKHEKAADAHIYRPEPGPHMAETAEDMSTPCTSRMLIGR